MKRYIVEGIADVGAVLFEIVSRYEKTGFAEARMIPKDLKTARQLSVVSCITSEGGIKGAR